MTASGRAEKRPRRPGILAAFLAPVAERRVRLVDLPAGVRVRVVIGLTACTAAGALLVVRGMTWSLPGGAIATNTWGPISRAFVVVSYLTAAVVFALLVAVASLSRPLMRRLIVWVCALAGAALGSAHVVAERDISRIRGTDAIFVEQAGELVPAVPYEQANTLFLGVLGWAMIAAAILLALLPWRIAGPRAWVGELLAGTPFLLGAVLFVFGDAARLPIGNVMDSGWDESVQAASGLAIVSVVLAFAMLLTLHLLWQAFATVRLSRAAGIGAQKLAQRGAFVLAALLVIKLALIGAGYRQVLGRLSDGSRANGLVAWLLACGLATVGAVWLARPRSVRFTERGHLQAAWFVIAGFSAVALLTSLAALASAALVVWPGAGLGDALRGLTLWLTDQILWGGVLTVFLAAAVGVVALLTHRLHDYEMFGVFCLAFAVWALPRAVAITIDADKPPHMASVDPLTLDTVMTVAVAILALVSWYRHRAGRSGGPDPAMLALVLMASTWACYGNVFFEISPDGAQRLLFFLGLAFPALYLFGFDAAGLNEAGTKRVRLLLTTVAAAALLLLGAATQAEVGYLTPAAVSPGQLGSTLFVVPFLAMLVAATITSRGEADEQELNGDPA